MSDHGPRINFAVSAHGYGHLTQAIAVAQAMLKHNPQTRLRFQCGLERDIIADKLGTSGFEHDQRAFDIGLIQPNPLNCDLERTAVAYDHLHDGFVTRVKAEAQNLRDWGADLVIADIPYLSIAAAASAGIDSIGIASLSWDKVISAYFDLNQQAPRRWYADTLSAYAETSLALLPEPALAGDCFQHKRPIPPIAIRGKFLPELRPRLGIAKDDQRPLVICSLGGIAATSLPLKQMYQDQRFHWLINVNHVPPGENMHRLASVSDLRYQDILASAEGLVSKPGYATAVEAAIHQLPMVYTSRGHFPDEPVIMKWLQQNARAFHISEASWLAGEFGDHLQQLIETPQKPAIHANGAEVAVSLIQQYL